MRFSIVTPVYNAGEYLEEMLASVESQSFTDWELRIVDDGSSDTSRAIIENAAAADPRVKPLFMPRNSGGCFLPRREAMEAAEGDYVVNIDADDTVEPDYLMKLNERIEATGADLVYADMHIDSRKVMEHTHYSDFKPHAGKALFKGTLDGWEVSGLAATKRSLALRSLALFDAEFGEGKAVCGGYHDENLTRLDLFLAKKVAFADAAYHYRKNPESITQNVSPRRFEQLEADYRLAQFTGKHYGKDSEEYRLAHRQLFHHTIESIRFLNRHRRLKPGFPAIKRAFGRIDFKAIKGDVSPRYWALMQTGYPLTKFILGIYAGKEG